MITQVVINGSLQADAQSLQIYIMFLWRDVFSSVLFQWFVRGVTQPSDVADQGNHISLKIKRANHAGLVTAWAVQKTLCKLSEGEKVPCGL